MAEQTSGRLAKGSSLRDLIDAAAADGILAAATKHSLTVRRGQRLLILSWPPAPPVPKSAIQKLLPRGGVVLAVPAQRLTTSLSDPPFLPCCIKPDLGTRGLGVRFIRTIADWRRARGHISPGDLIQPLLSGHE